jgi:non-homologous end joining protein Ku
MTTWQQDDESEDELQMQQNDVSLFVIDVSPSMCLPLYYSQQVACEARAEEVTIPDSSEDWPLVAALQSVISVIYSIIKESPNSKIGISVFGCYGGNWSDLEALAWSENEKPAKMEALLDSSQNVLRVYPLDYPDLDAVQRLEKIIRVIKQSKYQGLRNSIGPYKHVSLADVFYNISGQLSDIGKTTNKSVFFITDNPDPEKGENTRIAQQRAIDTLDMGVVLHLFSLARPEDEHLTRLIDAPRQSSSSQLSLAVSQMSQKDRLEVCKRLESGQSFPTKPFWQAVLESQLTRSGKTIEDVEFLRGPCTSLDQLHETVGQSITAKSSVGQFTLMLGSEFEIGCKIYNPFSQFKPPVPVLKSENGEVITKTDVICGDSGKPLLKTDVRHRYNVGLGGYADFTTEEIRELGDFGPNRIQILGFKPSNVLGPSTVIRHSYLVRPDEQGELGSTSVFANLCATMLAKDKVAICSVFQSNRVPRIMALMATMEPLKCFMIPIPSTEDVRDVEEEQIEPSEGLIEAMSSLIHAATIRLPKIDNPMRSKVYHTLHSLATEAAQPEEVDILDEPFQVNLWKNVSQQVQAVNDQLKEDVKKYYNRAREHSDEESVVSHIPSRASSRETTVLDAADDLSNSTLPILKQMCRERGLKVTGRKDELLARLRNE